MNAPPISDKDFAGLEFPGRTTLRVHEVAVHLNVTDKQVRDLIEEGKLTAIDITAGASRKHWRIPVAGLLRFLREHNNLAPLPPPRRAQANTLGPWDSI